LDEVHLDGLSLVRINLSPSLIGPSIFLQSEGEDELKKRQLMELAIINGTYRDSQSKNASRKPFSDSVMDPLGALCYLSYL